ncbi:hypothetical protein [Chromobacterium haemolyticum]|uniref:hypothetical protein n=1 Tax=Chromobacterium TaxID=535 RepID=UPI004057BB2C
MTSFNLHDQSGNLIGSIITTSLDGRFILGALTPSPHFSLYKNLFNAFEHAANNQLFADINRLKSEIQEHSFYLTGTLQKLDRVEITGLQIMGNDVSFRFKTQATPPAGATSSQKLVRLTTLNC